MNKHTSHHFIYRTVLFWSDDQKIQLTPLWILPANTYFVSTRLIFSPPRLINLSYLYKTARPVCQDRLPRLRTWLNKFQSFFSLLSPSRHYIRRRQVATDLGERGRSAKKCQYNSLNCRQWSAFRPTWRFSAFTRSAQLRKFWHYNLL